MTNTGHKAAPKHAKASVTGTRTILVETPIRLYGLTNFTGSGEMVESVGAETHLIGVPTLIAAPDASFRVRSEQKFSETLTQRGFDESILALLEEMVDTRVAQQVGLLVDAAKFAEQETQRVQTPGVDPAVMLTAAEFGARLGDGLSAEIVQQREKAGQLFSVLAEGRHRNRKYPAFQLLSGVAEEPLQALLKALSDLGGALVYQFMTSPSDSLGGLSPLQLLIKESGGNEIAASLLALPDVQRLEVVLSYAADFHAELTAAEPTV